VNFDRVVEIGRGRVVLRVKILRIETFPPLALAVGLGQFAIV